MRNLRAIAAAVAILALTGQPVAAMVMPCCCQQPAPQRPTCCAKHEAANAPHAAHSTSHQACCSKQAQARSAHECCCFHAPPVTNRAPEPVAQPSLDVNHLAFVPAALA